MSKALAIIDFFPSNRGGHFRSYPSIIVDQIKKKYDLIGIYTADSASAPIELTQKTSKFDNPDIVLFCLNNLGKEFQSSSPSILLDKICGHLKKYSLCTSITPFVMWSFDMLQDPVIEPKNKWVGLGVLSAYAMNKKTSSLEVEKALFAHVNNSKACKGIFLWDKYATQSLYSKKIKYLPCLQNIKILQENYIPGEKIVIGLFGLLWGYRGVNLLTEILSKNKDILGCLAGKPFFESYNAKTLRAIQKLKRWDCLKLKFLEKDEEINLKLSKIDALILDGEKYPPPSGIAIRALASGRCIISTRGKSWINNLIEEFGCGIILNTSKEKISERIRNFYKMGGTNRCYKAARSILSKKRFQDHLFQLI